MNMTQRWAPLLLSLAAWLAPAQALEVQPYSPQALQAKQQAGETVGLHFHADWCPTCRAQDQVFNRFKGDAAVPGTLLLVDYDHARALRREMGVRMQSTLIVFKGLQETHRSTGETDPQALRAAWASAR